MVTISTSYYCPRITSMHTTPFCLTSGQEDNKASGLHPSMLVGKLKPSKPNAWGNPHHNKSQGHLFFFSLRPFQPSSCVCSAFPRKCHYVSNKCPSAILLHVCGIIGSDIWLITDRCSLASAGIHSTQPGNQVAWYPALMWSLPSEFGLSWELTLAKQNAEKVVYLWS